MDALDSTATLRPEHMSELEWSSRLQLAACYRLFDYLKWAEGIYNHITVEVPGGADGAPHYLINPYGLHYAEVTASNLVKIDSDGRRIDETPYPINPAGFTIHSAIHRARQDAICVMHTHTTAGAAVTCKSTGLRFDNFYAAIVFGEIAYHEFEGVTTNDDECPRLVQSLGQSNIMILRNHGLLVCGATLPTTFQRMWFLQRACELQVACDGMSGTNQPIRDEVLKRNSDNMKPMALGQDPGKMLFDALVRRAGIRYEAIQ